MIGVRLVILVTKHTRYPTDPHRMSSCFTRPLV